jgi:YD repeat-containing protein
LGRQLSFTYDSFQLNYYLGQAMDLTHADLQGVTCPNCLSSSIGVAATYDPTSNQLTSVTGALSHTWAIGYDSRGNATSVTDPLSRQITLGYTFQGQLTSVTDAVNNTTSFG